MGRRRTLAQDLTVQYGMLARLLLQEALEAAHISKLCNDGLVDAADREPLLDARQVIARTRRNIDQVERAIDLLVEAYVGQNLTR